MTASYEARKFGVRSAMPSRTAVELCPHLELVPARFEAYQEASGIIMAIFRKYATVVEPLSLDEAFLDVTEHASQVRIAALLAESIKLKVREATQLTVSLGVATTKLVAKVASNFEKPDGLTIVLENDESTFLAPMPIRRLWGIGPKSEEVLRKAGIERIGQLAMVDDNWIVSHLGPWGFRWRGMARGEDIRQVSTPGASKQTSREMTFERDTVDREFLCKTIGEMAERLANSLKDTGPARTVHIKLRSYQFRTITRQCRPESSVRSADDIGRAAIELLDRNWDCRPLRLIGVGLSNFVTEPSGQLQLFEADQ
jgi:nucleotidyltransferase/DNA polymerase involved in DNA repair